MSILLIENDSYVANYIKKAVKKIANGTEVIELVNLSSKLGSFEEYLQSGEISGVAFSTALVGESAAIAGSILSMIIKCENSLDIYCDFCGFDNEQSLSRAISSKAKDIFVGCFDPVIIEDPLDKHKLICFLLCKHEFYCLHSGNKFDFHKKQAIGHQQWLSRRKEYLDNIKNNKLDIKVLVRNLDSSPRLAKDNLTTGEEIDIYDCQDIDGNKNRGVWVLCNGKPLKLVKDSNYHEFDFLPANSKEELIFQIIHSSDLSYKKISSKDERFIQGVLSEDETNSQDLAQEICDELEIERRYNRSYISLLINNYRKNL